MSTPTSKLKKVEFSFNRFRQRQATIHIATTQPDGSSLEEQIQIRPGHFNYGGIVDALITFRYPSDKMSAIQNNYLADPEDAEHAQEFTSMQAWRKTAKAIAREALEQE